MTDDVQVSDTKMVNFAALRARRLAGCFPTPLWSWVFFLLVSGAVAIHMWFLVSIGFLYTPFLWRTDDPYLPCPQFWHDNLVADQQIARGVLVLAFLVWIHIIVALWLWILIGIREWTTPRLLFRSRRAAAFLRRVAASS